MVAVAAVLGAWARFHTIDRAPIDLEPGKVAHVEIRKGGRLTLTGGFTMPVALEVELVEGGKVTLIARAWNGVKLEIQIPEGGARVRLINPAGGNRAQGKVWWKESGP
jgi:hypothetical protein